MNTIRMKRRRLIVLIALGLMLVTLALCWLALRPLLKPRSISRPYLWNFDGICVVEASKRPVIYCLKARNGSVIKEHSPFCVSNSNIAYWSGDDHALARIMTNGEIEWFNPPGRLLRAEWRAASIWASGNRYVLINLENKEYKTVAVLLLDTATRKWNKLKDAVQARSDATDGSGKAAILTKSGHLIVRSLSTEKETRLPLRLRSCDDWSFDFSTNTVYYLRDNKQIVATEPATGRRHQWKLPVRYSGNGLVWEPNHHELWVSVDAPFSITGIAVFSTEGIFLGSIENGLMPDMHPQLAKSRIGKLLSRSSLKRSQPAASVINP